MSAELDIKRVQDYLRKFPDIDVDAVVLCLHLRRLTQDILNDIDQYFELSSLSRNRFDVLRLLFHHQEQALTPGELAQDIGVTPASMTSNLDQLEAQSYIRRVSHPTDRRSIVVRLTNKGRDFMARELPDHYRQGTRILRYLDQQEREVLWGLYEKVALGTRDLAAGRQ